MPFDISNITQPWDQDKINISSGRNRIDIEILEDRINYRKINN